MTPLSFHVPQNPSQKQAWQEFVGKMPLLFGHPYEYFGHSTYRDAEEIPPRHAEDIVRKRFRFFVAKVNERLYGKRWRQRGQGIFGTFCVEKHKSGYPHHHWIIGGENLRKGLRRLEIKDIWDELYGIARVWDYKGERAEKYITKYVTKGGVIDVFGGNNKP